MVRNTEIADILTLIAIGGCLIAFAILFIKGKQVSIAYIIVALMMLVMCAAEWFYADLLGCLLNVVISMLYYSHFRKLKNKKANENI